MTWEWARNPGSGIDESSHPDATHDAIQVVLERRTKLGNQVEGAEPGRLLPFGYGKVPTQLPDETALAVPLRQLAGEKDQVPGRTKGT